MGRLWWCSKSLDCQLKNKMNMKKILLILLCLPLIFTSCRKDDVYELNDVNATSYNANKNKLDIIYKRIFIVTLLLRMQIVILAVRTFSFLLNRVACAFSNQI